MRTADIYVFGKLAGVLTENDSDMHLKNFSLLREDDGSWHLADAYDLLPVHSQRGVEFRRWATKVLKEYLVRGYALNRERLKQLGQAA